MRSRMGTILLWLLIGLTPSLQTACTENHILAEGPNGDVTLFSDFPNGDERQDLAHRLLTRWQRTPVRPERAFRVELADSTGFRLRRNWRNLTLLGDMRSHSWSSELARKLLGEEAHRRLASTPAGHAFVTDAYADGQTVLILHATTAEAFQQWAAEHGQAVLEEFFEWVTTGLGKTLYASGEQGLISAGIERRHGFRLRVPAGFFVEEQVENRFVRLKQAMPSGAVLYLYIYYQKQAGGPPTAPFAMALRDTLASVYSAGDRIEPERTTSRRIDFLGHDAVEIYGLYRNEQPPVGGAFKSFCFREGDRTYLIDLAVFNPPGEKLPLLRILEAVARTFTPGNTA